METTSDVVKEGTVCGYSTQGKDACQVSSWTLGCLAILLSPHHFLIHRQWGLCYSPAPPFTLNARQGDSRGQAAKAWPGWPAWILQQEDLVLPGGGWEKRGDSGRKYQKCKSRVLNPLAVTGRVLRRRLMISSEYGHFLCLYSIVFLYTDFLHTCMNFVC